MRGRCFSSTRTNKVRRLPWLDAPGLGATTLDHCEPSEPLMPKPLLTPFASAALKLPNRVCMAPTTRGRADNHGHVPPPFAVEYYAQRATAGLIVTEGTHISPRANGWENVPGIYTRNRLQVGETSPRLCMPAEERSSANFGIKVAFRTLICSKGNCLSRLPRLRRRE